MDNVDTQTDNVDTQTDWKSGVEEGLRSHPSLEKFKSPGEVFKSYVELEKHTGAKGAIVPGEKATDEDWGKFYDSTGRPAKAEDYKFSPIENLHPQLKMTPEDDAGYKNMMHKHGLSAKQADGLYKDYIGLMSNAFNKRDETSTTSKHEAEKEMRASWGAEYDNNLNKAKRLITKYGGADGAEAFGELGNNPKVLKTLASIAQKFSEDGFVKGDLVTTSEKNDAQQKIDEIMMTKDHPYWNQVAGHNEAVQEMKRLQTIVHPDIEA